MIVCCGEALFDVFFNGEEKTGALNLVARVGGSPFNVAIGIARLGGQSALLTGMSRDLLGERLHKVLEREGVSTHYLIRSGNRTTISLVGVDENGQPGYVFYGLGSADCSVKVNDLPLFGDEVKGFHFGSYSLVVRPVADAFAALLEKLQSSFISVDPNVRTTVEPDLDVWRSRLDTYIAKAHLIKVNLQELHTLYPNRSAEAMACDWLSKGVKLAVITNGSEDVSAWTDSGHEVRITPPATDVVDTVGAGDSFQAALLAGLYKNGNGDLKAAITALDTTSLNELVTFAISAARLTCSRQGADLPTLKEAGVAASG